LLANTNKKAPEKRPALFRGEILSRYHPALPIPHENRPWQVTRLLLMHGRYHFDPFSGIRRLSLLSRVIGGSVSGSRVIFTGSGRGAHTNSRSLVARMIRLLFPFSALEMSGDCTL